MEKILAKGYTGRKLLLEGFFNITLGILLVIFRIDLAKHLPYLLIFYFFVSGVIKLFGRLFSRENRTESLLISIVRVLFSFWLFGVSFIGDLTVYLVVIFLGVYQLFIAIVNFITYWILAKNQVKPRKNYFFDGLINILLAITAFCSPDGNADLQIFIIGFYLTFLGLTNIRDGIFFDSNSSKSNLKRKFRFNAPIFITAIMPRTVLSRINDYLLGTKRVIFRETKDDQEPDIEVLIHVTKDGFGQMGHVDLAYKGQIITYGNYDVGSEKLFGMIGDGVLIKAEKDKYIEYSNQIIHKTLFGYGLKLNNEQKAAVDRQFKDLESLLIPWQPPADKICREGDKMIPMYAYNLKQAVGVDCYKFKKSKFKTYFLMSTNCVLLADSIIGQAGLDIIIMHGIITPGTMQDYLEREYEKPNSNVVRKTVYSEIGNYK